MEVKMTDITAGLEAKQGNKAILQSVLYDRYGNVAYNADPTANITLQVPSDYSQYADFSGSTQVTVPFRDGIATTPVYVSDMP